MFRHVLIPSCISVLFALSACSSSSSGNNTAASSGQGNTQSAQDAIATATPIKHLVVIFNENRSFDHYFGTYPVAANPLNEPAFAALPGTPIPAGLTTALLTSNPNVTNPANVALATAAGEGGQASSLFNPFRLDRAQANTSDQNHAYTPEELAYDNGAADAFPANTGKGTSGGAGAFGTVGQVMGYFDGNTVTALWNYAQHFAMSDNAYTDTYGPSSPGAIGVVSGTTNGAVATIGVASTIPDGQGGYTLIGDTDPTEDACSSKTSQVSMTSKNIGDLLNARGITWGGFMGGFDLTATNANGTTGCSRSTFSSVLGASSVDYSPHRAWFQFYTSTSNPAHTRPSSTTLIGFADPKDSTSTPVHHQYDVNDFIAAVKSGNFPSVSYIKAPVVMQGHPGDSDPLDEQAFMVNLINFLEQQPDWKNTAVVITWDDSDGWYDHKFTSPTTSSNDATLTQAAAAPAASGSTLSALKSASITGADQLNGQGICTSTSAKPGVSVNGASGINGLCGPGTRIPFIVISPWAKANFVDHTLITHASVVRFIEDNWLGGQRIGQGSADASAGDMRSLFDFSGKGGNGTLWLDPDQGTALSAAPASIDHI